MIKHKKTGPVKDLFFNIYLLADAKFLVPTV